VDEKVINLEEHKSETSLEFQHDEPQLSKESQIEILID